MYMMMMDLLLRQKMPKTTFDLATETIAWLKAWNVTVIFNRSTYHLWIISMKVGIERMTSYYEICMTQDIAWKDYLSKKSKCVYDNEMFVPRYEKVKPVKENISTWIPPTAAGTQHLDCWVAQLNLFLYREKKETYIAIFYHFDIYCEYNINQSDQSAIARCHGPNSPISSSTLAGNCLLN